MADKFSPRLLKFLKAVFNDFDKDGDGKLTKEDIGNMMRFSGENPTDERIQFHFNEFDLDDNETVDFSEYLAVVAKQLAKGGRDCVRNSFQSLDKDGDGYLSREDLSVTFGEEKIEELMNYDKDLDGRLSFEEFGKWVEANKILGELFSGCGAEQEIEETQDSA